MYEKCQTIIGPSPKWSKFDREKNENISTQSHPFYYGAMIINSVNNITDSLKFSL